MVLSSILPTVFGSQHHRQQLLHMQQQQHSIDDHIGRLRIIDDPHDCLYRRPDNHETQSNISTAHAAFRMPRMIATALHRLTVSVNSSRSAVSGAAIVPQQQPAASSHDGVTPFSRRRVLLWTVALTLTVAFVSTAHVRHQRAEASSSSERQEASTVALSSASAITGPTSTTNSSESSGCKVRVSHFVLWDALASIPYNDSNIAEHARLQLYDGAALCSGDLPPKVNIQAVVDVDFTSNGTTSTTNCNDTTTTVSNATTTVVFDLLSMPKNRHRTEWEAPYMLAGHRGYKIFSMNLPVGAYALAATPNGNIEGRHEIAFRVFDC